MSATLGERLCEGCGRPLPALARPNQRHHNPACRASAYRRRQAAAPAPPVADALPGLTAEQQAVLDEAVSEPRLVALIARAASKEWRAAAWILERRFGERWSLRPRDEPLPPPAPHPGDPFLEVDMLAERRRRKPDGY